MLTKIVQRSLRNFSTKEFNYEAHDQQLRNWMSRLLSLTSSPASKMYASQLSALMNYYNRTIADKNKTIDWNAWKSKIITKGFVEQVETHFKQQSSHQYELDRIFNDIFTRDSKAIDQINNEIAFHTTVWVDNYSDYISFLSDLQATSSPSDYTYLEYIDFHPGIDTIGDALTETHNYLPGSKDDINLYMYMGSQFSWGKKFTCFYRHPADDFKGGRATKNTMGR